MKSISRIEDEILDSKASFRSLYLQNHLDENKTEINTEFRAFIFKASESETGEKTLKIKILDEDEESLVERSNKRFPVALRLAIADLQDLYLDLKEFFDD